MCSWRFPSETAAGTRLAVKDLFDTAGLVTTYGSSLFAQHVPATTAPAVVALEAAGYGIVGKTNLHEFAYGTTSENPHFGVVPNPLAAGPRRRAARAAETQPRSSSTPPRSRSEPTRAAPSASRPRAAVSSASSRRTGSCRSKAASRSLRASTTRGRWRATSRPCEDALARARPRLRAGARSSRSRSSRSRSRGSTTRSRSFALVCSRQPAHVPRHRSVALPRPDGVHPLFDARGGGRAPRALRGERRPLRRGRAHQDRALPGGLRGRRGARRHAGATEYRDEVESALAGFDLVLTPTLPSCRAANRRGSARRPQRAQEPDLRTRSRSTRSAGRRLRSPAGRPKTGSRPPSSSAAAARIRRARLAAGKLLESVASQRRRAIPRSREGWPYGACRRSLSACGPPRSPLVVLLATLVASAPAMDAGSPAAPKGLHGFLLRPNEPVDAHVLAHARLRLGSRARRRLLRVRARDEPRVRRELRRLVERLDRRPFRQALPAGEGDLPAGERAGRRGAGGRTSPTVKTTIAPIRIPAVSVNLTLPWFTGKPYALYAHVRAVTTGGASAWSRPFGFDMRWEDTPVPLPARPGLVRWTPIDGRNRLRGLVRRPRAGGQLHQQDRADAHERRRPARPLHVPPRRGLVADRRVARSRRAAGRRSRAERPSGGLVRAVDRRLRGDEPGMEFRAPQGRIRRLGPGQLADGRTAPTSSCRR